MNIQAQLYIILTNRDNEKCIVLTPNTPFKTVPENPTIIYDGNEHAILQRNNKENIIIDFIPKKDRSTIKNLKQILVVEYDVKTKTPTNEYLTPIIVKPVPQDIIKDLIQK